jgi:hypothetical protein
MQSFLAVRMMPSFAFMMALAKRGKAWAIICYLICFPHSSSERSKGRTRDVVADNLHWDCSNFYRRHALLRDQGKFP